MVLPSKTAIPDATTRASAAARKTISLEYSLFVAKSSVASWVLSPSSANKTVKKIVRNILKFICPSNVPSSPTARKLCRSHDRHGQVRRSYLYIYVEYWKSRFGKEALLRLLFSEDE